MRFLHIEDNPQDAELVEALLKREWPELSIEVVSTHDGLSHAIEAGRPDLMLSDFSLPSFDGLSALRLAREKCPDVPFLFLSGTIGEETAVEALKQGAIDYVVKDRPGRLVPAIQRALKQSEEQNRRRLAEEELNQSRQRFQRITENVADLIIALDLSGKATYRNPALTALAGGTADGVAWDLFTHVHPEDRGRVERSFQETVRAGKGHREEYRLLLPDGSVRDIEAQSSVVRDAAGNVTDVLIVARDATERKRTEQRLQEQASLLDKARDAICVAGLDHKLTYWNASAERLFGWSQGEMATRSLAEVFFPQDPSRYSEAVKKLVAEGEWQGELRPRTKREDPVVVESRWTLVNDSAGAPRSILFINTDITERKKLEVQFLRAQRLESIGTLAGGIAHDLNNVLTPVLIASQMLKLQARDEESRQLLGTIEKSALHGASLIKQVLLFARGAEGEFAPIQLRQVITDTGRLLRETLPRSIDLRIEVPRDLPLIRGDATQLNQVVMNLCVNARDAMPPADGMLTVTAQSRTPDEDFLRSHPEVGSGEYVVITVTDNGCGIPPENLDRIFDPFFTTKELGKGTGLGLSTVLGIVRSHKGVLQVTSEVGKGTRFEVYLPAIPSEPVGRTVDTRSPLRRGNGETILVIDDEAYIRDVVGSTLRHCGYRTLMAADGVAGLELFQEYADEIAAVLVDMMMPVMDGPTTIAKLRGIDSSTRIVAMSGMLDAEASASANAFIRKPITVESLLTVLANTLAR